MICGKLIAAGTMEVDGEIMTGVFVETTIAELRDNRADIFEEVIVQKKVVA